MGLLDGRAEKLKQDAARKKREALSIKLTRVVGQGASWGGCHDWITALVFLANTSAVFILAFIGLSDGDLSVPEFLVLPGVNYTQIQQFELAATAMGTAFSGGFLFVLLWYVMLALFAYHLIVGSQVLMASCLLGMGSLVIYYANGEWAYYYTAALLLSLGTGVLLYLICIRDRIPFTAAMLQAIAQVLGLLPELLIFQFLFTGLAVAYFFVWLVAFIEYNDMIERQLGGEPGFYEKLVLNTWGTLSFFWVQIVLSNISAVTSAGAVGSWYYSPEQANKRGCLFCRPSVNAALFRALTLNLGSIAFGSFCMALVKSVVGLIQYIASQAEGAHPVLKCIFCCCVYSLRFVNFLVEWMNEYAFIFVAVYGEPFVTSGFHAVQLLRETGVQALVNESLVGTVISLADIVGMCFGMAFGYLAVHATGFAGLELLAIGCGALMGYMVTDVGMGPVDSGCKTLFLCFAEEPDVLRVALPKLHALMSERMPSTVNLHSVKVDGLDETSTSAAPPERLSKYTPPSYGANYGTSGKA